MNRRLQANVRLSEEEHRAFHKLAKACGMSVAQWLRLLGREAAGMAVPRQRKGGE